MNIQTDEEIRAIIDRYFEIPEDEYALDEAEEEYHERLKGE